MADSDFERILAADKFAERVKEEFYRNRGHDIDGTIERDWMLAIKKVVTNHECPDCKYSILKGHQS